MTRLIDKHFTLNLRLIQKLKINWNWTLILSHKALIRRIIANQCLKLKRPPSMRKSFSDAWCIQLKQIYQIWITTLWYKRNVPVRCMQELFLKGSNFINSMTGSSMILKKPNIQSTMILNLNNRQESHKCQHSQFKTHQESVNSKTWI